MLKLKKDGAFGFSADHYPEKLRLEKSCGEGQNQVHMIEEI